MGLPFSFSRREVEKKLSYSFVSNAQVLPSSRSGVENYTNFVTSQHKTKPKFMTWLAASVSIIDDAVLACAEIPTAFDIDNSVGIQLDVLGEIVGRSRELDFQPSQGEPVLDDTNYRIALKAKIAQNQWDGTIPAIYEIWANLFPDIRLSIVDNQDMTMSALIDGQMDSIVTEMVASGYIIPKPSGVKLTIIDVTSISGKEYVGMLVNGVDYITIST